MGWMMIGLASSKKFSLVEGKGLMFGIRSVLVWVMVNVGGLVVSGGV